MFEKLKEYWLYIVLWLIALWALAYAFLSTSNAQKGWEVVSKIQDKLVTAIAKNQKVKDKTTIVDHISDLDWLTIGSYKLSKSPVTMLNVNWDDIVTWWELKDKKHDNSTEADITIPTAANTTWAWKLQLIMMTNKAISTTEKGSIDLESKKAWTILSGTDNFKNMNEQLRWFLATGYVWFGTFADETSAKEFRDSYFSTWMIVKKWNEAVVMIEIAR